MNGEAHTHRRRLWNRGMSPESQREYEGMMQRRVEMLLEELEKRQGVQLDLVHWIRFWSCVYLCRLCAASGS